MANVLNRTTLQLIRSASPYEYAEPDWLADPDLSAVEGWPTRYWVLTGDVLTLMDQAERDALDAALAAAAKDATADELDAVDTVLRAFAEVVLDELNARAAAFNTLRSGIQNANNLNDAKAAAAAAGDYQPRTLAQLKAAVRVKLNG